MIEWHEGDWGWYRLSSHRDPADRHIRIIHLARVEILRVHTARANIRATIRFLDYPQFRARNVSVERLQP